jgi:hypothetical protein
MAHVDHRLTKVNSDDPIIMVNDLDENLGRHTPEGDLVFGEKAESPLTLFAN